MTPWPYILAADDGFTSVVEVVIAIVVILLALLGKVLRKGPTQAEQEAQRRRWEELRRAREEALRRAEAERKTQRTSQQEYQPQTQARQRGAVAARTPAGQKPPPPPRLPMPRLQPQAGVLTPSPPAEAAGVQQELRRQAERLDQEQRERKSRLAPRQHVQPSAGLAGVQAVGGAHGDAYATPMAVHQGLVENIDLDQARLAIIYHEILSPPKAPRNEPESWEL